MLGRGQPGRSRRGQCPRHGGARTPRLTHGRPSGRGTRRGKRQNRCSAQAARGPALLWRSRRLRPPPRRSSRPRQRPGGGRKSQALGSCLIGLVLVFSATPPVAGRVAPLQPPPPLRFSGCGTGWKEQMGTLSMRLARPAPSSTASGRAPGGSSGPRAHARPAAGDEAAEEGAGPRCSAPAGPAWPRRASTRSSPQPRALGERG